MHFILFLQQPYEVGVVILILETREQRPGEVRKVAQGLKVLRVINDGMDANGLTPEPSLLTSVFHPWGHLEDPVRLTC